MIVGLDIDGVLADSVPAFLQLLNSVYDRHWTPDDITCYRFEDALGLTPDQMTFFWKLFARQGRWGKIKPCRGAIEFTLRLAKKHAIVCITGRPRHYVEIETRAWLRQHHFAFDDLLFLGNGNNKLETSREAGYRLDVLVEDSYEYGRPLADAGVKLLLMDYPWNRNVEPHPNIVRVHSLNEAYKLIQALDAAKAANGLPPRA